MAGHIVKNIRLRQVIQLVGAANGDGGGKGAVAEAVERAGFECFGTGLAVATAATGALAGTDGTATGETAAAAAGEASGAAATALPGVVAACAADAAPAGGGVTG